MQVEHLFVGVISCFDGRATRQARAWTREQFAPKGAVIDLITSLAPERALAGVPSADQEGLRAQIIHAAETHGITDWVLAAHAGCEAGEATMAETLARLAAAASTLRGWGVPARRVAAIYVDEAGMVKETPIYG